MIKPGFIGALALVCAALLSGCGGAGGGGIASVTSGGGSGGGIGGTGLTSSGAINGFGSVFVNGVEFETDGAEILVNGKSVGEDALGLGMLVVVTGSVNDDGMRGTATRIVFDDDVQGPVEATLPAADGDSMLVTVLGTEVIAERTATVFEGVTFATLAVGDLVEVSGFPDSQGRLRATRIEKKDTFQAGVSQIGIKGVVSNLAGTEFLLGGYTVNFSGADLSEVPGGALVDGMQVEVEGTLDPQALRISASRIEEESGSGSAFNNNGDVNVQGVVTDFVSSANMRVNDVAVDASNAVLSPSDLVLGNGMIIEAEGLWENGILKASRVEGRRGRVEIEAAVASVDSIARTLTMQLQGGTINVLVDSRTMLDDDTDEQRRLTLADIRPGDFLELEALGQSVGFVATRINRDKPDDEVLQGTLDKFVAGDSVTVLGITYGTAGAQFKSLDNVSLTPAEFYAALTPGALVKVKDTAPADGVADSVALKYADALDGERDFEDEGVGEDGGSDDEVDKPDETDEVDEADEPEDSIEDPENPVDEPEVEEPEGP